MQEPTKLVNAWADFLLDMVTRKPAAYVQIRKFHHDVTWDIPWDVWSTGFDIDPGHCQYASWASKYKQLDRNYLNMDELEKVRLHFLKRIDKAQTCVTARFGNQEKGKDSMGFCMQTISLNFIKKGPRHDQQFIVEVYYRTTELGKKFTADLHYLNNKILPIILKDVPINPDLVRIKLCTAYYSSMFLPILFNYRNAVDVVKAIKENDFIWYDTTVSRSVTRWLEKENPYNWQTQARQWENFDQNIKPNLTRAELRTLARLGREER